MQIPLIATATKPKVVRSLPLRSPGSSDTLALALCLSLLSISLPLAAQSLDPIQHPAVGVRVIRPQLPDERGSGFIISVENDSIYLVTARHLLYSDNEVFKDNIKITFALDPLREHPASWFVDFFNLDLAVLTVSTAKLPAPLVAQLSALPPMKVRPSAEPLKLREDVFLLGGKFQDWQLPTDKISGLQDTNDRLDRFRFTGTGVHSGFSGSGILDSADRLVGVHLGAVPSDESYGRAQRIGDAIPILAADSVPMNRLDIGNSAPSPNKETRARPTITPGPSVGTIKNNSIDGLNYVWIPPGYFQMGCSPNDNECFPEENPPHKVTLTKGFWLGQTPVTQAAYARVMKGTKPSHFKGDNLPVDSVNWYDAKSYCEAIGGRLPTEAEWEYAARAGTTQNRYGEIDNIAWYLDNSGGKTHPVATKQPNAWKLFDMLGNVWQWTADWYDEKYYEPKDVSDPQGPLSGTQRGMRGGSWLDYPRNARVSDPGRDVPSDRNYVIGVRCVWESFP